MLIIGAGGHSKEILDVLTGNGEENLFFMMIQKTLPVLCKKSFRS